MVLFEEIYGDVATVYHRCADKYTPFYLYRKEWKSGSAIGTAYGDGLYTCYKLSGGGAYNKHFYGDYIVKGYVKGIKNFFIFNKEIYEKLFGKDDDFINTQNQKFGLRVDREDVNPKNFWAFATKYKINRRCDGIIFDGGHDGPVLIVFNPYKFRPMSIKLAKSSKWQTLEEFYKDDLSSKDLTMLKVLSRRKIDTDPSEHIQDYNNPKNALKRSKIGLIYSENNFELYRGEGASSLKNELSKDLYNRIKDLDITQGQPFYVIKNGKKEFIIKVSGNNAGNRGRFQVELRRLDTGHIGQDISFDDLKGIPENISKKINIPEYKTNLYDLLKKYSEQYEQSEKKVDEFNSGISKYKKEVADEADRILSKAVSQRKSRKFTSEISFEKYMQNSNNIVFEKELGSIKVYKLKNFSWDLISSKKDAFDMTMDSHKIKSHDVRQDRMERLMTGTGDIRKFDPDYDYKSYKVQQLGDNYLKQTEVEAPKYGYKKPAKMYELDGCKIIVSYDSDMLTGLGFAAVKDGKFLTDFGSKIMCFDKFLFTRVTGLPSFKKIFKDYVGQDYDTYTDKIREKDKEKEMTDELLRTKPYKEAMIKELRKYIEDIKPSPYTYYMNITGPYTGCTLDSDRFKTIDINNGTVSMLNMSVSSKLKNLIKLIKDGGGSNTEKEFIDEFSKELYKNEEIKDFKKDDGGITVSTNVADYNFRYRTLKCFVDFTFDQSTVKKNYKKVEVIEKYQSNKKKSMRHAFYDDDIEESITYFNY